MGDDLEKRRFLRRMRYERRPTVPPRMDGSIEVVVHDLDLMVKQAGEVLVEVQSLPEGDEALRQAVVDLGDAAEMAHALALAADMRSKT